MVQYGDIAAYLAGGAPEAPRPTVLQRTDGIGLFYAGQNNYLFGEPESGKTFIALAAAVEALNTGGKATVLDMDHNGIASVVTRLLDLGADEDALSDLERFRYKEPEDKEDLISTVKDLRSWRPDVAVLDSIGELLPLLGLNSNSPDDFTIAHTHVIKPLYLSGAAVISIDHLAKNPESKAQGPTGTGAKKRATGGSMLRVTVKESFTPGAGGSCYLNISKDRHGGLKASSPTGEKEPLAGTFRLYPDGEFKVYPASGGEATPTATPTEDLDALARLDPPPTSARDVKSRMRWGSNRAAAAWKAWSEVEKPLFPVPHTEGRGTGTDPSCPLHTSPLKGCYTCDQLAEVSEPSVLSELRRAS